MAHDSPQDAATAPTPEPPASAPEPGQVPIVHPEVKEEDRMAERRQNHAPPPPDPPVEQPPRHGKETPKETRSR